MSTDKSWRVPTPSSGLLSFWCSRDYPGLDELWWWWSACCQCCSLFCRAEWLSASTRVQPTGLSCCLPEWDTLTSCCRAGGPSRNQHFKQRHRWVLITVICPFKCRNSLPSAILRSLFQFLAAFLSRLRCVQSLCLKNLPLVAAAWLFLTVAMVTMALCLKQKSKKRGKKMKNWESIGTNASGSSL